MQYSRTPKPQVSSSAKIRAIREKKEKTQPCSSVPPQSAAAKKAAIRERRAQSSSVAAPANGTSASDSDGSDCIANEDSAIQAFAPPVSPQADALESLTRAMQILSLPDVFDSSRYFSKAERLVSIQPAVLLQMFETLVQSLFKAMPHTAAGMSLTMSKLVETASLTRARGSLGLTKMDLQIIHDMPKDIRTVHSCFDLDPEIVIYATCPDVTCCAVYPPIIDSSCGITHYPLLCTNEKFGKVCDTPLTKQAVDSSQGVSVPVPLRPFPYRPFRDHLASMLSQSEIEHAIREHMRQELKRELQDIIGSPAVKNIRDPSGLPFLRDCGSELRLVWALCIDWYNPLMNKVAGKSISVGIIAFICLSLPPHLRLLEQNVYKCGVIPGTQEPSLDAINNFLDPVVSDLQIAYDRGVHLTRTHDHPTGRNTRHAVVTVIADTLASKKTTGNCSHSGKHFCSHCSLPLFEINNLNQATWPPNLTRDEHKKVARRWLDASTKTERKNLFAAYGIRWSSLWNLSYYDPSLAAILEAVHVILLGLVPRHCREMLGLNIKDLQEQDDAIPIQVMQHARRVLFATPTRTALKGLTLKVLKALCLEQNIAVCTPTKGRRKKADYIAGLLGYDSGEQPSPDYNITSLFDGEVESIPTGANMPPPITPLASGMSKTLSTAPFLTKQELLDIRRDIAATIRPAWQADLPKNFGCAEHGKLKADQWRTALEFDIPVSLVRILTNRSGSGNIAGDMRSRRIVEHTMDLAIAMAWGLSRRTSPHHAERYGFYMTRYIAGIQELYPDYDLKPKHHYALHVPSVLLNFGPLHGVWAFGLERLIGRLQKLNTNFKNGDALPLCLTDGFAKWFYLGEMEVTTIATSCKRSNLIAFLSSRECPPLLKEAWARMQKYLDPHDLDIDATSEQSLPSLCSRDTRYGDLTADIHRAFTALLLGPHNDDSSSRRPYVSREVAFHHQFHQDGVLYTDFRTNLNHSIIYFRHEASSQLLPAQIRCIFTHNRRNANGDLIKEVFFAVHPYLPSDNAPFAPFPDFRAAIFNREPAPQAEVIRSKQAHCHANQRPWDHMTVVMRAIDRVRYPNGSEPSVLLKRSQVY